jgi:hypothetical protein
MTKEIQLYETMEKFSKNPKKNKNQCSDLKYEMQQEPWHDWSLHGYDQKAYPRML